MQWLFDFVVARATPNMLCHGWQGRLWVFFDLWLFLLLHVHLHLVLDT